jgi:hypothetical protein
MLPFVEHCAESAGVMCLIGKTYQITGSGTGESECMCLIRPANFSNPMDEMDRNDYVEPCVITAESWRG